MIEKIRIEDRIYFKSSILETEPDVQHFFTSRQGGVSCGKIEGLNLGFRVGDDVDSVKENYRIVANDFDIPYDGITSAKQTHSRDIRIITEAEKGCGVSRISETFEADGLVTSCKGIALTVFYADCVPILLSDSTAGVVAAVHSGWRGTVSRIAENAVDIMKKEFGSTPENIKAAIGPSIGKCCFETGEEVACNFDKDLVTPKGNGKFLVDLWTANRRILKKCGVCDKNIDVLGICTICENDILYSYRTHGDKTGRMGAVIMIK